MTTIKIYDKDAEKLEEKAYELNWDLAELVSALVDSFLDDVN